MKIEVATHVIYRQSRDCRRFLFLKVFLQGKGRTKFAASIRKKKKIIKENESQLTATLTTDAFRFVRLALFPNLSRSFLLFPSKSFLFSSIVPYFLLLTQPLSIRRRRRTRAHTTKTGHGTLFRDNNHNNKHMRAQNTQKKNPIGLNIRK